LLPTRLTAHSEPAKLDRGSDLAAALDALKELSYTEAEAHFLYIVGTH
jgi:hypothetical protein